MISSRRLELQKDLLSKTKEALDTLDPVLKTQLLKNVLKNFLTQQRQPKYRRVTRSISRTSQITNNNNKNNDKAHLIPSTPKISPYLPETPAAIKKQKVLTTTTKKKDAATRILGSTITSSIDPDPVLTVQLDNGKVVNVDLAADPNNLRMSLGAEALKEVKQRMETYASQVANFFRKLKNI